MKYLTAICLAIFTNSLYAADSSWGYSSEHVARTKTFFNSDTKWMHVEAEVLNYNQDHNSRKMGLDYLRTQFVTNIDENSSIDVEIMGERGDDESPDARNFMVFMKKKDVLFRMGKMAFSFMSQLTSPLGEAQFESEGMKPAFGIPIDYYSSDLFSAGAAFMMESSLSKGEDSWQRRYFASIYLNLQLTQKLSAYMDFFADKNEDSMPFGYGEMSLSLNYQVDPELRVNVGTWAGGDPELITKNFVVGASMFF